MAAVYTIGHSSHDITDFLDLLKKNGIEMIVDVRSEPYSRQAPQFGKEELERFLLADGVEYRYSGSQLGGHPKDSSLYTSRGILDYYKITGSESFQNEIKNIISIAQHKNIALLCSEGLPKRCHREKLLGQYLRSIGYRVIHILPDGEKTEIKQLDLF